MKMETKKLKVLELFGGISSPIQALLNLGIDFETVDYVEHDKQVVEIRNIMYNSNYKPQNIENYHYDGEVDLIVGGSPCQNFSNAGKKEGGEIGSGTKSSLIWEQVRVLGEVKPKYYIWENVSTLLNKRNINVFNKHNKCVEELGYRVHYKVLNAKDYGIPQNRQRVFVVAIRNDVINSFDFANIKPIPMEPLKSFLETPNDLYYYVKNNQKWVEERLQDVENNQYTNKPKNLKPLNPNDNDTFTNTIITAQWKGNNQGLILEKTEENSHVYLSDGSKRETFIESPNGVMNLPLSTNHMNRKVATGNKCMYTITTNGKSLKVLEEIKDTVTTNLKDPYFHTRPISTNDYINTITAKQSNFTLRANENKRLVPLFDNRLLVVKWNDKLWNVRILTEWEVFALMGFKKTYVNKLKEKGVSRSKIYYVAGNSIVVNVLEFVLQELLNNKQKN